MGCAISSLAAKSELSERNNTEQRVDVHLTEQQIHIIKDSWKVIRDDIAKVGIIMFVSTPYSVITYPKEYTYPDLENKPTLFETHPECKDVFFLFRGVEDLERLRTSRELRAHGLRVMSFIEKSVGRLDQLERLEALALELGKNHYHYNASPKYYSYVGAEFIGAVQPILKERWTADVEDAWKTMFLFVTGLMTQGYQEESTLQRSLTLTPKDRADKNNAL